MHIFNTPSPCSPPTPTQKKKLKDSPLPVSPPTLCSPISDGPGPLSLGPLVRKSQPKAKAKAREVSGVMDHWGVVGGPDAGEPNQPVEDKSGTLPLLSEAGTLTFGSRCGKTRWNLLELLREVEFRFSCRQMVKRKKK